MVQKQQEEQDRRSNLFIVGVVKGTEVKASAAATAVLVLAAEENQAKKQQK